MREILFRGKRVDNGEWVYGAFCPDALELTNGAKNPYLDGFIRNFNNTTLKMQMHEVDRETVGQFTGLTDKNGSKIFEGDILPIWEQGEEYPYKVIYNADCFMLAMLDSEQGSYPLSVKHNQTEVIGNIHDNPELIGGDGNGEPLTWGESWEKALNAVRRYGSYNQKAALDSLDPLTRKCVDNIGYMQLCMSENIMVERAHFQKIFEIYAKREQVDKQLPPALQQTISRLQIKGMDGQPLQLGNGV